MSQRHPERVVMEHRYGTRADVFIEVLLRTRDGDVSQGWIRNVNSEGMYIRTDLNGLQKGTVIDIEFTRGCCIRGWVAHTQTQGIGLMFVSSAGCMQGKQPPPVSRKCLRCLHQHTAVCK